MGEEYWGTKRLKAPEEYTYEAVIDGATNVFTLGALIFHFIGSYSEADIGEMYKNNAFFPCSLDRFELNREAYEVTLKAVNKDRSGRYQAMSDFFREWDAVVEL